MSHYTGSVPETDRPLDWRLHGACRRHDEPDIWFASASSQDGREQTREAQAICHTCPVLLQCGRWALANREEWGVWGGMTESQRRSILRQRATKARNKGGRPRAECGTNSAYDRHIRLGEPIDDACRRAHALYSAERRAQTPRKATA